MEAESLRCRSALLEGFGVHPVGQLPVMLLFEENESGIPPRLMLITDLASEIRALENGR